MQHAMTTGRESTARLTGCGACVKCPYKSEREASGSYRGGSVTLAFGTALGALGAGGCLDGEGMRWILLRKTFSGS